ncbi:MAG: tyrosine-type recombinase/integrase [Clostridiales bacterium]|nr:tyrosine-type recombinase/integrase [Clostridiales bacterium]
MRTGENIFKRKDGRWEARYRKGRDSSGKIIYGYCYGKTYAEAKKNAESARICCLQGEPYSVKKEKISFEVCCYTWIQQKKICLRTSTYIKYQGFLRNHIIPYFGNLLPFEVSSMVVSSFSELLLKEKKLAPKTVKDILVVLNAVLQYVASQHAGQMCKIDVIYPCDQETEIRVLSIEEQKTLADFLLRELDLRKLGILLALTTGIRLGELCALQWDHIFLEKKLLRIDASMQRISNLEANTENKTIIVIGPPKSRSSVRTIPIPDGMVALCKQFRPASGTGFVLTGTEQYMEPRTVQRSFAKYAAACGLENVTVHTCRHTFATRCIEAGFEMKSLSEIMGHANVSITMNRYVHCSMALKQKNMEKVNWPGIP